MKTTVLAFLTLCLSVSDCYLFSQEMNENKPDFPVLKGPYLGQKPPDTIPEVFAPEIFSNKSLLGICILENGDELYYSQFGGSRGSCIMYMQIKNGQWLQPQTAPFSREFENWDLNMSPDGRRIYFSSNRPLMKDGEPKIDPDIWYTEKTDGIWGEPKNIGLAINTDKMELQPTIAENGNLYFFGRHYMPQIYVAYNENGQYLRSEILGNEVNISEFANMDPFIAPDESYLIFHSNRDGCYGESDLYICYKDKENDCWTKAINMGPIINSKEHDMSARVSLNGKYLFFTRLVSNTKRDLYWVDSKIIDDLKPEELKQ